jgi:hypothetical protein
VGRRLALRWHSVFFTCTLLDSSKKPVFVACDKQHKKSFFVPWYLQALGKLERAT